MDITTKLLLALVLLSIIVALFYYKKSKDRKKLNTDILEKIKRRAIVSVTTEQIESVYTELNDFVRSNISINSMSDVNNIRRILESKTK